MGGSFLGARWPCGVGSARKLRSRPEPGHRTPARFRPRSGLGVDDRSAIALGGGLGGLGLGADLWGRRRRRTHWRRYRRTETATGSDWHSHLTLRPSRKNEAQRCRCPCGWGESQVCRAGGMALPAGIGRTRTRFCWPLTERLRAKWLRESLRTDANPQLSAENDITDGNHAPAGVYSACPGNPCRRFTKAVLNARFQSVSGL